MADQRKRKSRTMYMHTLDGQPACFDDRNGAYLYFASNGHRSRAAKLVSSLGQLRNEQRAAIREDWRRWNETKPEYRGERPSAKRYGYVLVEVPNV